MNNNKINIKEILDKPKSFITEIDDGNVIKKTANNKAEMQEYIFNKYLEAAKSGTIHNEINNDETSIINIGKIFFKTKDGNCIFNEFVRNINRDSIDALVNIGLITPSKIDLKNKALGIAVGDAIAKGKTEDINYLFDIIDDGLNNFKIEYTDKELDVIDDIIYLDDVEDLSIYLKNKKNTKGRNLLDYTAHGKIKNKSEDEKTEYKNMMVNLIDKKGDELLSVNNKMYIYANFYFGCLKALSSDAADKSDYNKNEIEKLIKKISKKTINSLENNSWVFLMACREFTGRFMGQKEYNGLEDRRLEKFKNINDMSGVTDFAFVVTAGHGSLIEILIENNNNKMLENILNDIDAGMLAIKCYVSGNGRGRERLLKKRLEPGGRCIKILDLFFKNKDDKTLYELSTKNPACFDRLRPATQNEDGEVEINYDAPVSLVDRVIFEFATGNNYEAVSRDLLELNKDLLIEFGRVCNNVDYDYYKKSVEIAVEGHAETGDCVDRLIKMAKTGYMNDWSGYNGESFYHLVTEKISETKHKNKLINLYDGAGDWVYLKDNEGKTPYDMIMDEEIRNKLVNKVLKKAVAENKPFKSKNKKRIM